MADGYEKLIKKFKMIYPKLEAKEYFPYRDGIVVVACKKGQDVTRLMNPFYFITSKENGPISPMFDLKNFFNASEKAVKL